MTEWAYKKLDEYVRTGQVELGRGNIISKLDIEACPGPYPIYSSSAQGDGKFGEYGKFMFDEELISWSVDGGGNFFYRPKHQFSVTNVSGFLRIKTKELGYRFLYYSLALQHRDISFDYTTKAHPSVIRKLYSIPSIPKHEQDLIARVLSTVDEAIEQTEALITKYQQIKTGLMHDLFTRGVTPDGHLRPTRVQAPHLYKESPLGWIPIEWDIQRLDSVAEVSRGKFTIRPRNDPRFYGGQYPFIQTGDVALSGGRTLSSYSQTLNEKGLSVSRLFPPGTIMVTIAANIADTCIIGIPMCAPDSLVGVQPKAQENARFIELSIRRRKTWLAARAPQTAQRNINLEDLRPLLILWPRERERSRISEIYETQDAAIEGCEAQRQKLQKQKHGLMHDLLTGRVRAKVGEPAST